MSRIFFLLLRIQVFAASSSAVMLLAAQSNLSAVYEIDVSTRGAELVSILNVLLPTVAKTINTPAVSIQTTLPGALSDQYGAYKGILNGTINYVQSITLTMYNTLVIVTYLPYSSSGTPQTIVLPIEQIVDLVYFPDQNSIRNLPRTSSGLPFTSTTPPNTLIFYSIDPYKRALDIISAYNSLKKLITTPSQQIWIQTTMNGPFNPSIPNNPIYPSIQSGLLQQVSSVALTGNGLLAITFQTINQAIVQTIYVPPEQIQQVIFIRNFNAPKDY